MTAAMEPFDIADPLPTGTTLLEASAGTGKTWTIGALVTRFVAEGRVRLDQMLVVTFGRAASHELRERVRDQLVRAEAALREPPEHPDALLTVLLDADPAERDRRHANLRAALADFDAATIATTHQFCSMVLDSLGVAGDTDSGVRLVESLDDLLDEVVDDLYLRKFAYAGTKPEFTRAQARSIAGAAIGDPRAQLLPDLATTDTATGPGLRAAFATAVRVEMERRKRRLGILSYDDLLGRLADALEPEDSPARLRMRERWQIVLVDEFQDTDPVQWQVLDRAFSGHATMVLIGDPKQAIYAFRGGDVFAYLAAADGATARKTLSVNWRSDRPLLDSLQQLIGGAALGVDEIVVRPVTAQQIEPRLAGAPKPAPLRVRVLRREDLETRDLATVRQTRPRIAEDLALDIRALLESGATWDGRPLLARDIAVIAYRHADLAAARDALHELGVRAVIAGGGSVFATPAAVEWLTLLEALEQPHRALRVRAAALTCFLGQTAVELDAGGEMLTDRIADRFRDWSELLVSRGVAAVYEAAGAAGLAARLLAETDGERRLTDVRQLAEALHQEAMTNRLGPVALVAWLRRKIADARAGRVDDRTRRLDSDEAAVQLVTIHASKGLEYPVVYLPALADRWVPDAPDLPLFHDADGRRSRHVGSGGPGWEDAVARHTDEESGEWLRLLYVAMTRAKSQVVCWWAPTRNAVRSPLHRVLSRAAGSQDVPESARVPDDGELVDLFARWRDSGAVSPELLRPGLVEVALPDALQRDLSVRRFTRVIDTEWRRTSYSSLTSVAATSGPLPEADAGSVGSEPEDDTRDDEAVPEWLSVEDSTELGRDVPSPMAGLPVGATFGSLVHGVLEHADPAAPERGGDLRDELLHQIAEQLVAWPVTLDPDELADALVAVLESPLGPLADDTTLRDLPWRDRLREMEFELPLAGGDDRGGLSDVHLGDVAALLREHLPAGDPVRPYAERLDQPALGGQLLHGYLTGSVDVVLRVGGRYLVVDYKTNWLGAPPIEGEAGLTAHDYRPEALAAAMTHSDYPLQALLYSLVLHRFLRWRQPGYDPEQHLGGVLYLYLRGMCGADTPRFPVADGLTQPAGVFGWRPPAALVVALSDVLDGRVGGDPR